MPSLLGRSPPQPPPPLPRLPTCPSPFYPHCGHHVKPCGSSGLPSLFFFPLHGGCWPYRPTSSRRRAGLFPSPFSVVAAVCRNFGSCWRAPPPGPLVRADPKPPGPWRCPVLVGHLPPPVPCPGCGCWRLRRPVRPGAGGEPVPCYPWSIPLCIGTPRTCVCACTCTCSPGHRCLFHCICIRICIRICLHHRFDPVHSPCGCRE